MAVNLASKYEKKVDERFKLKSLTEAGVNKEYDWAGVNAINVYSIPTVAMNDYVKTGTSRYGAAAELDNTVQTMTLTRDRGFTFTIDRGNHQDTQMVMQSGKALARQIDEVIVPEIDTYRLSAMASAAIAAGGWNNLAATTTDPITASNAYESLLEATEYFGESKAPRTGYVAWVTPAYYKFIKLDNSFIKASEIGQKMLINGQVGEVDGVKIVVVPSTYLPLDTDFVVANPVATVAANKLEDYKTHDNPPGINGWLVEGRKRYDAFVLENKKTAIYTRKNAN